MTDKPRTTDPPVTSGPLAPMIGPGRNDGGAGDTAAGGNGATEATDETRAAMLSAALAQAAEGHPVFPAPPGEKKSYKAAEYSNGKRWGQTTNRAQICEDWKDWPDANIGLPTGTEAGFFVVEADTLEGHAVDGIANLQALIDANGPLPDTRMHRSPSGSIHRLFNNPPGVFVKTSQSRLAPGVDVLGEGGMIIAPPSIKPGVGQYVCENPETPIAVPTVWLLALVTADADNGDHVPNEDLLADDQEEIIFAFDSLRNDDLNRSDWHDRGMALWAATNGSEAGFEAFKRFSMKSKKYKSKPKDCPEGATVERWKHWRKSPPDRIGAGSIKHWADEDCPGWRDAYDAIQDAALEQIKQDSLAVDQVTLDALLSENVVPGVVINGQASHVADSSQDGKIEVAASEAEAADADIDEPPEPSSPDPPPAPTPPPAFDARTNAAKIAALSKAKKTNGAAGGTWFNPVDLWGSFDPPELPTGLLPDIIEQYAFVVGANMGCDPAGLAMAALTICAAAIPDRIKLRVKQHDKRWHESARLWTVLVGDPSARKSPILREAARPLAKIDRGLTCDYLAEKLTYDELSADQKKTAAVPKHPRVKIEDTTIEAAQEVLKDSPDGVLCLQDELTGFFGAMDKYSGRGSGADRAFWNKAYNGGEATFHRIGRGSGIIPNLSISMLGGIQPDAIRKVAADGIDDGLLQRELVIVLCAAKVDQDKPRAAVVDDYDILVDQLHRLRPGFNDDPETPRGDTMLRFDQGAQTIRNQLAEKHITMMASEIVHGSA